MKLKKLVENFNKFFKLDEDRQKQSSDEINELMDKLIDKRASLEKKIHKEKDKNEKHDLIKKLNAVKKLIKKAKESLAI